MTKKQIIWLLIIVSVVLYIVYVIIEVRKSDIKIENEKKFCSETKWVADTSITISIFSKDIEKVKELQVIQIRGGVDIISEKYVTEDISYDNYDSEYYTGFKYFHPIMLTDTLIIRLSDQLEYRAHSFQNHFNPHGPKKSGDCRFYKAEVEGSDSIARVSI